MYLQRRGKVKITQTNEFLRPDIRPARTSLRRVAVETARHERHMKVLSTPVFSTACSCFLQTQRVHVNLSAGK